MTQPENPGVGIQELWRYNTAMKVCNIVKKELLSENSKFKLGNKKIKEQAKSFDPYLYTLCIC